MGRGSSEGRVEGRASLVDVANPVVSQSTRFVALSSRTELLVHALSVLGSHVQAAEVGSRCVGEGEVWAISRLGINRPSSSDATSGPTEAEALHVLKPISAALPFRPAFMRSNRGRGFCSYARARFPPPRPQPSLLPSFLSLVARHDRHRCSHRPRPRLRPGVSPVPLLFRTNRA